MKRLGWIGVILFAFGAISLAGIGPLSVSSNLCPNGGNYLTYNGVAGCYTVNLVPLTGATVSLSPVGCPFTAPLYGVTSSTAGTCTSAASTTPTMPPATTDSNGVATFSGLSLVPGQFTFSATCTTSTGSYQTASLSGYYGPVELATVNGQAAPISSVLYTGFIYSPPPAGLSCPIGSTPIGLPQSYGPIKLPLTCNSATLVCTQNYVQLAFTGSGTVSCASNSCTTVTTTTVISSNTYTQLIQYTTSGTTSTSTATQSVAGFFTINGQQAGGGIINVPSSFPVSATVTSGAGLVSGASILVLNSAGVNVGSYSLPASSSGAYGPATVTLPATGIYTIAGYFTVGGQQQQILSIVGVSGGSTTTSSSAPLPVVPLVLMIVGGGLVFVGRKGRRR